MTETEYYEYSFQRNLPARCPILNICERRADTLMRFNEPLSSRGEENLLKEKYMGDEYAQGKIPMQGEYPLIISGNGNYFYGNVCPEVTLFDRAFVPTIVPQGIASISGEWDKFNEEPKSRVLKTRHFSQCGEYAKVSFERKLKFNEKNQPSNLLNLLLVKSARLLERRDTMQFENVYNDILSDWLRDKGFIVSDQSRTGISKSNAGQPDILIREENGHPVTIIETFRLRTCSPENQIVADHLNRLLNQYDALGLQTHYVIIFAENADFNKLWISYLDCLRTLGKNPAFEKARAPQEVKDVSDAHSQVGNMRVGHSVHSKEILRTTVYHIFLNFHSKTP